jgi:hypothetical protein
MARARVHEPARPAIATRSGSVIGRGPGSSWSVLASQLIDNPQQTPQNAQNIKASAKDGIAAMNLCITFGFHAGFALDVLLA